MSDEQYKKAKELVKKIEEICESLKNDFEMDTIVDNVNNYVKTEDIDIIIKVIDNLENMLTKFEKAEETAEDEYTESLGSFIKLITLVFELMKLIESDYLNPKEDKAN